MRLISIMYLLMLLFSLISGVYCVCSGDGKQSIPIGLSKNNTDAVKGILAEAAKGGIAAGVLLSHLVGHTSYHLPLFSFKVLGCIGVGCFFFLSGYGLIKASMKEKFYEGYLKRHTSKLLLPFLVMFIIWVIIFQVLFKEPLSNLLHSFAVGAPVSNSWYVFASLYCYFLFWEGRNQSFWKRQCIVLVGLIIWILIFAVVVDWPDWWYKTIACFYIGIIVSA